MGVITNLAVSISILSAFPWVRNTHHKYVPISAASLAAFSHPPNPLQRFRAAPSVHRLVSTVFPIGQASAPCVLTLASRRLGLLSSRYPFRAAPYPDGWCARTLRPGTFSQRARIHPNPHRICCACARVAMLTAVCSFFAAWVFVVLGDSYDLDTHSWNPDGIRVIRQQDFWYTFGMTVLYVSPLLWRTC